MQFECSPKLIEIRLICLFKFCKMKSNNFKILFINCNMCKEINYYLSILLNLWTTLFPHGLRFRPISFKRVLQKGTQLHFVFQNFCLL